LTTSAGTTGTSGSARIPRTRQNVTTHATRFMLEVAHITGVEDNDHD
jgi:hypothetical protein